MNSPLISGTRILYLLYAVALFSALLYLRFPVDKFARYLEVQLTSVLPTIRITAGECTLGFPPSLRLDTFKVVTRDDKTEIAALVNVELRPDWRTMGVEWLLRGELYGGTLEGRLALFSPPGNLTFRQIELKNLSLEQAPVVRAVLQRTVSGALHFSGEFTESGERTLFQGEVSVDDGSFELQRPFLALKQVEMTNLEFSLTTQEGRTQIKKGMLRGAALSTSFSGDLTTGEGAGWGIDLAGELITGKELQSTKPQLFAMVKRMQLRNRGDGVPYTLKGNVQHPIFHFGKR